MALKLGMLGMIHTHAHGMVRQVAAHADEFQLLAAFDPEADIAQERGEAWQAALPALRLCQSAEELLALPLDGVIVEGRVEENLHWTNLALQRDLPVLLEKPAGTNLAAFRQTAELARSRGLHLQLGYLFRYMSAVLEMLELARSGSLGQIYQFRARLPKDLRLYDQHDAWYGRYPGGIFFEMAGHVIDMMVAMLGAPRRVTPYLAHHHQHEGPLIDNALAVFEYEHAWATIEVNALEIASDARRIEVYGTQCACIIPNLGSGHLANDATQTLETYRAEQAAWQQHNLPAATLQIRDLREFAACIRGEKQPDYSLDHDLSVQQTLLSACGVC